MGKGRNIVIALAALSALVGQPATAATRSADFVPALAVTQAQAIETIPEVRCLEVGDDVFVEVDRAGAAILSQVGERIACDPAAYAAADPATASAVGSTATGGALGGLSFAAIGAIFAAIVAAVLIGTSNNDSPG